MNFTHLSHKTSHVSPSKTMYIYTFAIVTVHIYTVIITVYTIILLISLIFFSLLRVQNNPHLLFPQIHTNTSTQTNQHKDTQTHPHEQTNKERERDRCWCWLLVDQWIGASGGD